MAFPGSASTFRLNLSKPQEHSYSLLPTRRLVTQRRFDLAVKWRLFESFRLGSSDPDVERLYLWHIAARRNANRSVGVGMDANKASDAAYIPAAKALYQSMVAKGFDPAFPVPVDPNGELLGGAHRVACALALKIESIVVEHQERLVWAPAWGEQWFAQHGLSGEDLERLRQDWLAVSK